MYLVAHRTHKGVASARCWRPLPLEKGSRLFLGETLGSNCASHFRHRRIAIRAKLSQWLSGAERWRAGVTCWFLLAAYLIYSLVHEQRERRRGEAVHRSS